MMELEDYFYQAVNEWIEHCRRNSHHSFASPYLDCDAYRRIVSLGPEVLLLIREQLNDEYEKSIKYESELRRLKMKVFGTDSVELFGDDYRKMCEDEEYQEYQERRHADTYGNPGIHWCCALQEIVPEYRLPVGEKGSGSPVERVAPGFVGLKVYEVQKATIEWLDGNMDKYVYLQSKEPLNKERNSEIDLLIERSTEII